ncbi:MAG: VanZ family protein [Candidatus Moraniibacteriota bacterium]|nr:MAG: VanZ family protein [Candidatus Moranbacteria bacterium]
MKSIIIVINISWALLTWRLTTTPNLVIAPENLLNTLMMMGGHFTFFGIQAVLLRLSNLKTLPSIIIASFYGLLIELVQLRVPGRSADPLDWLLDTLGAVTFLAIMKNIKLFNKFSNF